MDLLKITNDPSYPNDFINEIDNLTSSILIINEGENANDTSASASGLNRSFSSSSSSLHKKTAVVTSTNLDICRISNRLLVTSGHVNNDFTNDLSALRDFLKAKYRDKYLIWNIGPHETQTTSSFNFRLIPCTLPKSQSHTLKFLFHQCHAMLGWLQLSPENVVVIQCADGWGRSGLLMSCLMKFSGAVDSTFEALNIFQSRRLKTLKPSSQRTISQNINLRYLKYFNDLCSSRGRVPNPASLCLHQIIISTIPIFDSSGSCSPGLEIFQNNELKLSSACIGDKSQLSSDIYLFKDDYNIIFKLKDNSLARDIQLHIFHSDQRTGQRTTILSFTFNTAFFHPGVIRLRPEDLEIPLKDSDVPSLHFSDSSAMKSGQKRFKNGFCVDLILLPSEDHSSIDYVSTARNNEAKNLLRLSQMLPIRPDRHLIPPLLLPAFPKFYCKLALQLYANDLHDAHEFLVKLRDQNCGLKDLEKSFLELTKVEKDVVVGIELGVEGVTLKEERVITVTKELGHDNITDSVKDTKNTDSQTKNFVSDQTHADSNAIESLDETSPENAETLNTVLITNSSSAPLPSFSGIGIKHNSENQSNIPPPPPLPAPRIPPPPPPPPMPSFTNNNSVSTGGSTVNRRNSYIEKPRIKNTLHWNELSISAEEIDQGTRRSIWHDIAKNDFDAQLNTSKFEEMFCIGTSKIEGDKADSAISSTAVLPVVIDIRRANNVGIGLSRFQRRFDSFDRLIEVIYLNETELDLDDFLTLKSILPTDEEVRNLKLIKKSDKILVDRMGPAELFMFQISTDPTQKNLLKAIDYKIFELTCVQELEGLKHKFDLITKVLEALKSSEELKIILKATLDLGNLATYEYGRSSGGHFHKRRNSAYGFTLDSLCKLHEVKSVDNQSNLLIFLTSSLAQSHPEALKLITLEEFKDLEAIKGWSDKQLIMELEMLQDINEGILNDIDDLNQDDVFKQFWMDAKETSEQFKQQLFHFKSSNLHNFHQTWNSSKLYFGHSEDESDSLVFGDVSAFLINIWQFFRNFEVAIKQVKKQLKHSRENMANISNGNSSSMTQSLSL